MRLKSPTRAPIWVSGQEFTCGDVVDVILTEQGGTDNEQYLLSVRVIPGR